MEKSSKSFDENTEKLGKQAELGGKRKEPEPDSDDVSDEEKEMPKKKVMTVYDLYQPGVYPWTSIEQSERFLSYTFLQPSSSHKYNWFQR